MGEWGAHRVVEREGLPEGLSEGTGALREPDRQLARRSPVPDPHSPHSTLCPPSLSLKSGAGDEGRLVTRGSRVPFAPRQPECQAEAGDAGGRLTFTPSTGIATHLGFTRALNRDVLHRPRPRSSGFVRMCPENPRLTFRFTAHSLHSCRSDYPLNTAGWRGIHSQ